MNFFTHAPLSLWETLTSDIRMAYECTDDLRTHRNDIGMTDEYIRVTYEDKRVGYEHIRLTYE